LALMGIGVGARADEPGASAPEIVAARELFRQGTEDVDAGRYELGLEKFRRVAAVKETPNVRFNIARCEESLKKTGAALADFETAEREASADPKTDDVAKLAHDRAAELRPRVPRLQITTPLPPASGLEVTLDGAKLALTTLGVPLPVDPGPHVVGATAPGRAPFHASVTLSEGDSRTVPVALTPNEVRPPSDATIPQPFPLAEAAPTSSRRTWGAVTLVSGGVLAAGSLAFLLVHNGAVSSVKDDCPGGACPVARKSDVTSLQSRANTTEALSIGFVAAAALAGGVGLYLELTSSSAQTAPNAILAPGAAGAPAGLSLLGRF
jgi:hypothetical protein